MNLQPQPTVLLPDLRIGLASSGFSVDGLPVLAGAGVEEIFEITSTEETRGSFQVFDASGWLVGYARVPVQPSGAHLEESAADLYQELLGSLGEHKLARVWNYIPAINRIHEGGLENYRGFCRGRSVAFERVFGHRFMNHAPAASAVGTQGDQLVVCFAASRAPVRHLENPWQVPAYDYPPEHGPRSPTFARASVVEFGGGKRAVFISGTASIRGHETMAPGDTKTQTDCTLENLYEISRSCGLGDRLAADRGVRRHIKVYLRHASDLTRVRVQLNSALIGPHDQVSYLHSDICRRELNVEIEVSIPLLES